MTNSARTCDILTYSLYSGDATSQHTFDLARVLSQTGIQPAIYSNYAPHDLPVDIRPIAQQASFASYTPNADLTILQYPLWFPLAERFRTAPAARLFWYHGVTPPEHWPIAGERDLLRTSQIRTELANCAHLAVAASQFTASELRLHSGYPADRMRVVPLGVDTAVYSRAANASLLSKLREHWRLHDKHVILYVGRIAGNKRIDIIIDALANLTPEYTDLHLLVVGDERSGIATQVLTDQLRRRAHEHGISDRVTFTGRVPDVAPYYSLAELFVLPSQHEGFGVPLVEAMAAGTPVIASASGAMPWLLNATDSNDYPAGSETAGLLFEPGDAEKLSDLIAKMLSRPDLYAQGVERGHRRAQDFDLQTFRIRAALTMFDAIEMHDAGMPVPDTIREHSELYRGADIVQRDYAVDSRLPLLGKHIARVRTAATVHMKEAYFDRVIEQQVSFNRTLSDAINMLEQKASLVQRAPSAGTSRPERRQS